jgi:hypothetical protein
LNFGHQPGGTDTQPVKITNNLWNWNWSSTWKWSTTCETGNSQWNWPNATTFANWLTTCGTDQHPVKLVNSLWNWPTNYGTGQQPVELGNILLNWPTSWPLSCVELPVTCGILELRSAPPTNL